MKKVIGLTGQIAAGKDEVAKILRRRGADIIDADEIAHTLYEKVQSPVWQEIVRHFGSKILLRGGKISRKKLGEIVFADKKELQALDRIVHPYLKEEISKIVENRKSKIENGNGLVVVNAAVLKEIGLLDSVDEVWVVTASRATRIKRLLKAGLSMPAARQRISAQLPAKAYLAIADVVIANNGTVKQLNVKVSTYL